MKPIYLDYAAATLLDPAVLKSMRPYLEGKYANPSSLHQAGREVRQDLEAARKKVAEIIHAKPEEIIFTSGGTESINLAIKGVALNKGSGHIITTKIEHAAVLENCKYLEKKGFRVTYLPVDKSGLVSVKAVEKVLTRDTILISIHYVNNEIGTIQPIVDIGALAQRRKIPFHVDACQAGYLLLDVEKIHVDLLTMNGSKIHGPKGSGILYCSGVKLEPQILGGGQEFGLRSGTENVASIVGFAKALELVQKNRIKDEKKFWVLRKFFFNQLAKISDFTFNGHPQKVLPNNISLSFKGVEGEELLKFLSQKKIYVSTGSACQAQKIEISHVLTAIGLSEEYARGTIRITFGKDTTKEELTTTAKALKEIINSLRAVNSQK